MTMAESNKVVILGAGLAGLGAAYKSGFPLYEAAPGPGGAACSTVKDGFVFDIGIHVLQSKNRYFHDLLGELGVELVSRKRSGWIYSFGGYSRYPFQVNTSHLPFGVRARCVAGFVANGRKNEPANYEEWMLCNFGEGFSRNFLIPYAEKFWGVPPSEMTYEWTGNRVPRPKVMQVIKGMFKDQETDLGTHVHFQYPVETGAGFAAIATGLARNLSGVHYNMKATSVLPAEKSIAFNGGETTVRYGRLISTIPLPELLNLMPGVPPEITAAASRLRCNSIAVVNLGIARGALTDRHWVHFPEKEISFFRISFPSNFCDGLNPPGTSSIQAEVSYDPASAPGRDDLLRRVKDDLRRIGLLRKDDRCIVEEVVYQRYGYVIYDHARKDTVRKIHEYLNTMDIYPCGRYGAWEYLWSDEAISSGMQAAEAAVEQSVPHAGKHFKTA